MTLNKDFLRGRTLIKFFVLSGAIALFMIHALMIQILTINLVTRKRRTLRNIQRYSRFALKVMGVKVRWEKLPNSKDLGSNGLVVSNHLSYLDLLVLASKSPSIFVTSVDMGKVFFLGTMAALAGGLFVERRHRERLKFDIHQIEEALRLGFDVTLFPEGTSSNGAGVLPFKRSLLAAAINTKVPIKPITLKYLEIAAEPMSPENRDIVCWYGKMPFASHFYRLLTVDSVTVRVFLHPEVQYQEGVSIHPLADKLHQLISTEYLESVDQTNEVSVNAMAF